MKIGIGMRAGLRACAVVACLTFAVGGGGLGVAQTAAPSQTIAEKIAASKNLVDINTATAGELKALPGMGDAYVQRIVAGRPYTAKNQLVQRGILPAEAYAKIKEFIVAHRVK